MANHRLTIHGYDAAPLAQFNLQICAVNLAQNRYGKGMSAPRQIRNLVLTGFMGTGKSSIGRLAATQLQFEFIDTDALVEARAGKTIPKIFAQEGEAAFRGVERQVVLDLAGRDKTVISTGGGLVVNLENMTSLKEHALVICLCASPETIFERTRYPSHRPLLRQAAPLERIRQLLAEREPFYRQADVLINAEGRSVREVAQHVLHEFHQALRPAR
jgi:shikimate kinase